MEVLLVFVPLFLVLLLLLWLLQRHETTKAATQAKERGGERKRCRGE